MSLIELLHLNNLSSDKNDIDLLQDQPFSLELGYVNVSLQ